MPVRRPGRALGLVALTLAYVVGLLGVLFLVQRSGDSRPLAQAQVHPPIPVSVPSTPVVARLDLPTRPRVLIVGDSYSEGWGADPTTAGFAHQIGGLLDWNVVRIDGVGSTGYLNRGLRNQGTYAERIARASDRHYDLVVLQGGSNDEDETPDALVSAAKATLDVVERRFPSAQVLMMGPVAPFGSPTRGRKATNAVLARVARENAIPYVNPIYKRWFVPGDQKTYVNLTKAHPNNAGYRRIAERFAADVRELSAPVER